MYWHMGIGRRKRISTSIRARRADSPTRDLGRREREILEIVYRVGRATVSDVHAHIDDPVSYSAVRTMLTYLETKGHLRHEQEGKRYVYVPTTPKDKVGLSALRHVVDTFFDGSVDAVVLALVSTWRGKAAGAEIERLRRLVEAEESHGKRP